MPRFCEGPARRAEEGIARSFNDCRDQIGPYDVSPRSQPQRTVGVGHIVCLPHNSFRAKRAMGIVHSASNEDPGSGSRGSVSFETNSACSLRRKLLQESAL